VGKDGIIPSHSFSLDSLPDIRVAFVYLNYEHNLVADCVCGPLGTDTSAAQAADSVISINAVLTIRKRLNTSCTYSTPLLVLI
jgi:hypothetical protein